MTSKLIYGGGINKKLSKFKTFFYPTKAVLSKSNLIQSIWSRNVIKS